MPDLTSRRRFLQGSGAVLAASALGRAVPAQTASSVIAPDNGYGSNPTSDAALKFFPDGSLRPFAGNTVICHMPPQSRFLGGLGRLRSALLAAPFAGKLGILPVDSFHMTIFPGANDQARERSSWPGGVPLASSIAECTRTLHARLRTAHLPVAPPFRVSIDVPRTVTYGRACTLRMRGADPAAERALRQTRACLADLWQFHAPDQAGYGFHVTLAYTLSNFTPSELDGYHALLREHVVPLSQAIPVLELGLPEFCSFADMSRFTPELLLNV